MTNEHLRKMNEARTGPKVTCPASRHVAMIGEFMIKGQKYPLAEEDPEYCGEAIVSTVTSLWEARARIVELERALSWISLGPGYSETREGAALEMMRVASEALKEEEDGT